MTATPCPSAAELAAAFSAGPSEIVRRHLAECPQCTRDWAATARVVNAFRTLTIEDAPDARIEEQRTGLLASAGLLRPATSRRWVGWASGLAAAAVLTVFVIVHPWTSDSPSSPFHGSLTPRAGAAFTQVSSRPDEIVTLTAGALSVEVSPLSVGERFRVITTDAEVEVRGTAFEIAADGGHLISVRVWHGLVEVRPRLGAAVLLGAGGAWQAPIITATLPLPAPGSAASTTTGVEFAPGPAPVRRTPNQQPSWGPKQPSKQPSKQPPKQPPKQPQIDDAPAGPGSSDVPHTVDPGELAYQEAWSALRAGDHLGAATAFERAATLAPRSAHVEDAWYWRAVALARAGKAVEARTAFSAFLEHHGNSPRAPQASTMLGWLLFEAGELDAAASRFSAAAEDSAPTIRDSARSGLEAVRRRRGGAAAALPDHTTSPRVPFPTEIP